MCLMLLLLTHEKRFHGVPHTMNEDHLLFTKDYLSVDERFAMVFQSHHPAAS
jgi:hypothetical protein